MRSLMRMRCLLISIILLGICSTAVGRHHVRRLRCAVTANSSACASAVGGERVHERDLLERAAHRHPSGAHGWRAELCVPPPSAGEAPPHDACVHKPLLPTLATLDIVTMVVVFVIAALALASGIGGGGLYVPVLNLVLRFQPHAATGLSQALICGGAIGALVVNARERHPAAPGRPLIDYGLAAFLAPAEMGGAQLGVLLNQALPSPVILATMAALLSVLAVRTLRKGMASWARERQSCRPQLAPSEDPTEEGRLLPPQAAAAAGGDARRGGDDHSHLKEPGSSAAESPLPRPAALSPSSSLLARMLTPSTPSAVSLPSAVLASRAERSKAATAAVPTSFDGPGVHDEGGARSARPPEDEIASPAREIGHESAPPVAEIAFLVVVWVALVFLLVLRGGKGAPSLVHPHMHTCRHAYMHPSTHACTHACMHACTHACMPSTGDLRGHGTRMHMPTCVHTRMHHTL